MTVLLRGDCHGNFTWLDKLNYKPEETAIIILGDTGLNFWLNKTDQKIKKLIDNKGYYLYCIRGNHEQRPQFIQGMEKIYDDFVDGPVYWEPQYPHIRYFMDYGYYNINGYSCAVIGGAYSVDKWYRLGRFNMTEETNNPKKSGWFNDEQLTSGERQHAEIKLVGRYFDFVFTHTCPYSFQPTDLFLGFIDQKTVDNTMEKWMESLKDKISWGVWCFGHFHADRIERPYVEQYFNDIETLDTIYQRWNNYKQTGEIEWYLEKSPNFYMGVNKNDG